MKLDVDWVLNSKFLRLKDWKIFKKYIFGNTNYILMKKLFSSDLKFSNFIYKKSIITVFMTFFIEMKIQSIFLVNTKLVSIQEESVFSKIIFKNFRFVCTVFYQRNSKIQFYRDFRQLPVAWFKNIFIFKFIQDVTSCFGSSTSSKNLSDNKRNIISNKTIDYYYDKKYCTNERIYFYKY